MVNRPIATLQLRKTDAESHDLAGAVFKVEFSENRTGPWETVSKPEGITSGEDGLVQLDVEKDGYYRFIETQAPARLCLRYYAASSPSNRRSRRTSPLLCR